MDAHDQDFIWINAKSVPEFFCPRVQVRYRREHASGRNFPYFPQLEDLMRDVSDGASLMTVVHYYCPDLIKLDGTQSTKLLDQHQSNHINVK